MEFYNLVSGESVELNRFVDLSAMTAAAGFKLRARKHDCSMSPGCGNCSE